MVIFSIAAEIQFEHGRENEDSQHFQMSSTSTPTGGWPSMKISGRSRGRRSPRRCRGNDMRLATTVHQVAHAIARAARRPKFGTTRWPRHGVPFSDRSRSKRLLSAEIEEAAQQRLLSSPVSRRHVPGAWLSAARNGEATPHVRCAANGLTTIPNPRHIVR